MNVVHLNMLICTYSGGSEEPPPMSMTGKMSAGQEKQDDSRKLEGVRDSEPDSVVTTDHKCLEDAESNLKETATGSNNQKEPSSSTSDSSGSKNKASDSQQQSPSDSDQTTQHSQDGVAVTSNQLPSSSHQPPLNSQLHSEEKTDSLYPLRTHFMATAVGGDKDSIATVNAQTS